MSYISIERNGEPKCCECHGPESRTGRYECNGPQFVFTEPRHTKSGRTKSVRDECNGPQSVYAKSSHT